MNGLIIKSSTLVDIDDYCGDVELTGKINELIIGGRSTLTEPVVINFGRTNVGDDEYALDLSKFMNETGLLANKYATKVMHQ